MATSLDRPAYNQTRSRSRAQPAQPFDMAAMLAAFAQMQQAQQSGALAQQQNYFTNTNPLGKTAQDNQRPMGLTPENEWSAMFGANAASAMTPEARMASQGPSAMNQWAQLGQNTSIDPTKLQDLNQQVSDQRALSPIRMPDYAGAAASASPAPFQISPSSSDLIRGYKGPKKRKGSSFSMQATGNPRPGFSF